MSPILRLEHVKKRFGGLLATNDVSFAVSAGESLGLIGPNGAGKTTLFSLIMGEHRLDSGNIFLNGTKLQALPTHKRITAGIARTYQVPRPFADMNVGENIRVGLMPDNIWQMIRQPAAPERELEIALSVGLSEADVFRRPSELAMGNLRKLELARCLATSPQVLLLDEVFAGLTAGEIEQITELLNEKRKTGLTYVIVSHDLPSLKPLVDRVIAINQGQVIAQGSFDDVMASSQVRSAYLGMNENDEVSSIGEQAGH